MLHDILAVWTNRMNTT